MSPHEIATPTLVVALKTITLLLGGLITYLAYKAYLRTGARSLAALATGFGIITGGSLLAGIVERFIASGFLLGLAIESALVAVGFAVIVYSLYVSED